MKSKSNKLFIYIIESFFTALAFSTANRLITPQEVLAITDSSNFFAINFAKLQLNYLSGYGVNSSIIFILLTYFYYNINKNKIVTDKRLDIIALITGFLFATFMTIGNRFLYNVSITDSNFQILITLINYIGYFFLFKNLFVFLINILRNNLKETKLKKNKSHHQLFITFKNFKSNHSIIFFMLIFLICWSPYIIIFYPGTMNADSLLEIEQFFGECSWNANHPIFPTIIYGTCMKLGCFFSNDNLGLFFNNILQVILGSLLLSYSTNFISSLIKNKKLIYPVIVFFALFPTWPIHFYTEVKDVWFSISFLLFVIFSIKFIISNGKLNHKQWLSYLMVYLLFYFLFLF